MGTFRLIEQFGEIYRSEHVDNWNRDRLEGDWWYSLEYFFTHAFMRGRRDKLSNEYCYFSLDALTRFLGVKPGDLAPASEALLQSRSLYGSSVILEYKRRHQLGLRDAITHASFQAEVANANPLVALLTDHREVQVPVLRQQL